MLDDFRHHLTQSQLLPARSKLVVAVSGGLDSNALLDLLHQAQPYWGWDMTVAHLDHNLTGESSDDARMVARLARAYGYPFFLNQVTDQQLNQSALRRARYDFLENVRSGREADLIVTGTTADDRLENSVLNTMRGADRYGLTALKPTQDMVVRPLLPFSRGQLIMYATKRNLPYASNDGIANVDYSRSFVRHNLMPLASQLEPNWRAQHSQNLNQLETLTEQIDWQLGQVLDMILQDRDSESVTLDRSGFLGLSSLIQSNLVVYIARQLAGGLGLSEGNLARALEFIQTAQTGTSSNAIPHLIIERDYDSVILAQSDSFTDPSANPDPSEWSTQLLQPNRSLAIGGFRVNLRAEASPTNNPNYLVKPSPLYVRGWQAGDRIAPIGMNGHRKLQDIFIDQKIPRRARANWPLVVNAANQPVWLVNLSFDRNALAHPDEPHYQLMAEPV